MNIQEFVSQTLIQIVSAVADANQHFADNGLGAAAHPRESWTQDTSGNNGTSQYLRDTQKISFDIAVASENSNEKGAKGGGGLKVMGVDVLSASADGKWAQLNSITSRVSFELELKIPNPKQIT